MTYGFQTNYFKGATNPKGETWFILDDGDFEFNALNFEYLVVDGAKAQFKGYGRLKMKGLEQSGIAFIMTVIDGQLDGGGGEDKIRMKIFNKNTGEIYYDNEPGASDADSPVTLVQNNGNGDGVVVINTSTAARPTLNPESTVEVTEQQPIIHQLTLKAYPNPTEQFFNLNVQSGSQEVVDLKVFDMHGRVVYSTRGASNQSYRFGDKFVAGIYLVEVRQGDKRSVIQIVKQ